MKKVDLLPTHENLMESFRNNAIGRNSDIFYFVKLIDNIEGPYSIAIDGRWGSGKTFFVKQAKMVLDALNEYSQFHNEMAGEEKTEILSLREAWAKQDRQKVDMNKLHICVYYDAWMHDDEEDPIESLLYQISDTVEHAYKYETSRNNIDLLLEVVDLTTGKDFTNAFKLLKGESGTKNVEKSVNLHSQINEYFNGLLPEHADRLVVFIDELDRCNPSFAVKLLERVKHYFENEKITFVFTTNMEQLQHTIKNYFGSEFDAHRYLERFFDLIIPIPQMNVQRFYDGLRYDTDVAIYKIANAIVQMYKMQMREVSRYFETINVVAKNISHAGNARSQIAFCYFFLIPIALGLQKTNISLYDEFISGKGSQIFVEILSKADIREFVENFFGYPNELERNYEEKIKEIYDALFVESVRGERKVVLGKHFDSEGYNYLIKTIGMLNGKTSFEELE